VKTYPLAGPFLRRQTIGMFLRSYKRTKNGKRHEYFSVVENRRVAGGATVQRTVLYLGEITSSQKIAWHKTLKVFDPDYGPQESQSLFADSAAEASDIDSIPVKLSQMRLCRPWAFGDYWLGCQLWHKLGLDEFWRERLDDSRSDIPWSRRISLWP
jgi:hypothetical protein